MYNTEDFFKSKWLKADDLKGREVKVIIEKMEPVKMGDDTKPALFFRDKEKGLVLNKTNAGRLSRAFGSTAFDDWLGKEIILVPDTTEFQGKTVDCIVTRAVLPKAEDSTEVPF